MNREEINKAFEGYNFGVSDYVNVLQEALKKVATGFHNGSTIKSIMLKHGLIDTFAAPVSLTEKGLKVLVSLEAFDKFMQLEKEKQDLSLVCANYREREVAQAEIIQKLENEKEQSFICHSENVARILKLQNQLDTAISGLFFYADPLNWSDRTSGHGESSKDVIKDDIKFQGGCAGVKARLTLQSIGAV